MGKYQSSNGSLLALHIVCSRRWARSFVGEISRFRRIGISVHEIYKGDRSEIYRVPDTLEILNSGMASVEDELARCEKQGSKGVD